MACSISEQVKNISRAMYVPMFTILTVASVLAVAFNSMLLIALIKTKQVKSLFLISCLCVADLLNGAVTFPVFACKYFVSSLKESCLFQLVSSFIFGSIAAFSVFITILLALDRYSHMNPNPVGQERLHRIFKRPWNYILVILTGLACLTSNILQVLAMSRGISFQIFNAFSATLSALILLSVTVLYTKGYLRVKQFVDESPIYQQNNGAVARPLYVQRLFKTVMMLVIVTVISYLPLTLGIIMISVYDMMNIASDLNTRDDVFIAMLSCFALAPLIDPLIIFRYNNEAMAWLKSFCQDRNIFSRTSNDNQVHGAGPAAAEAR